MASSSRSVGFLDVEHGANKDRRHLRTPTDWFTPHITPPKPLAAPKSMMPKSDTLDFLDLKDTGDSAAWKLYNTAAREVDERLVKDWNSKLGGILLFAALFAGVITTLLVDTMTLLEPSNLDRTEALLYFLASQTIHHVDQLPPEVEPSYRDTFVYTRPHWAFVINGLLVSSLSFSILVALGAVVCLEWINEYEAGDRAISTPKKQALRRHYRFRAVKSWHMARLIGALPLMMFLVVMLFFVAFVMWLWRIDRFLALLPVLGASLTGGAHLITTILAVAYPSAPFKTSLTHAAFQIITFLNMVWWFIIKSAPIWWRFGLQRLRGGFRSQSPDVARRSYAMNWARTTHEWKEKIHEIYPWLPRGLQLRDAINLGRREDAAVSQDDTLRLSALAWVVNSLDLSAGSYKELVHILKEINKLERTALHGWGAFEYEAPWSKIFRIVLARSSEERIDDGPTEMELIIAELLEKMLGNQALFFRIIRKVDQLSLVKVFVESLARNPVSRDAKESRIRIRGMTLLLSSLDMGRHKSTEWPLLNIFKVLADGMQTRDGRTDSQYTSWIFALCNHNGEECDIHDPEWPEEEYVDFSDAFSSRRCRIDAIFRFMKLIDSILHSHDTNAEDTKIMFQLLIHHILSIHWEFEAPTFYRDARPRFIESGFNDPALNLISCTMIDTYNMVPCPPEPWSPQWRDAVICWCQWKRLVGSGFSSDEEQAEVDFLCRIWARKPEDESVFNESMTMLDGRALTLLPRDWLRIFDDLSKARSLTRANLRRILALFGQALAPSIGPGRSFAARLKSRVQPSSPKRRSVDSNPLLPRATFTNSPTTETRRSGSFHRYPPRHRTFSSTLGENSFGLSSLLTLISHGLGTYKPDDSEQLELRTVCVTIVRRVLPLAEHLEPVDVSLLRDLLNHLTDSDPRQAEVDTQACITDIRLKLEKAGSRSHSTQSGRLHPSSYSSTNTGSNIADRNMMLLSVPEVYDEVESPPEESARLMPPLLTIATGQAANPFEPGSRPTY